jgi:hypothetical protein
VVAAEVLDLVEILLLEAVLQVQVAVQVVD